jgi:hypothetical protein
MLVSSAESEAQRHRLTLALAAVMGRSSAVRVVGGGRLQFDELQSGTPGAPGSDTRLTGTGESGFLLVDGPTPGERAVRPEGTLMLLVVPEGISQTSLRRAAAEYLDGDPMAVVLVGRSRRGPRGAKGSTGAQPPAADPGERGSFFGRDEDEDVAKARSGDDPRSHEPVR